jgi:hypothetical protein
MGINKMKSLLITLALGLMASSSAFAYNSNYYPLGNGHVLNTPTGPVYIPNAPRPANTPVGGQGVLFHTNIKITSKTVTDPITKKDSVIKTYSAWVRDCNDVALPSNPSQEAVAHDGDRIELKFDRAGSCSVGGWKKY